MSRKKDANKYWIYGEMPHWPRSLPRIWHGAEEPQVDLYPPSEEDSKGGMFL